jgi:hypothetical protein
MTRGESILDLSLSLSSSFFCAEIREPLIYRKIASLDTRLPSVRFALLLVFSFLLWVDGWVGGFCTKRPLNY